MLVVIDTDCIGGYKSNYHTVMTSTVPHFGNQIKNNCIGGYKSNYHTVMTSTVPHFGNQIKNKIVWFLFVTSVVLNTTGCDEVCLLLVEGEWSSLVPLTCRGRVVFVSSSYL